jgi:hypothetical protein
LLYWYKGTNTDAEGARQMAALWMRQQWARFLPSVTGWRSTVMCEVRRNFCIHM